MVSTETTQGEYWAMIGEFLWGIHNQLRDRTDMSTGGPVQYNTSTDVYWFVTPAVATADATCVQFVSLGVCDQVRIRFNTTWAYGASQAQKRQGACHEIGHSVGFDDSQPESNTGCMSGGNQGVLSNHEIGHINAQY